MGRQRRESAELARAVAGMRLLKGEPAVVARETAVPEQAL